MTLSLEDARIAKVNGTMLGYCESGQGQPVVFVHGGTADLRVWPDQFSAFGRSHRAIAYSQRYARPNEPIHPDAGNPFDTHVEDLAAFLQEIDAAPAHVVGSSSGAFIALLTAIRSPELFRSLVLAEPPALTLFVSAPPRPLELLRVFATRPATGLAILRFALGTMIPATRAFERGDDEAALTVFLRGVLGDETFSQLSEESLQVLRDNASTLRGGLLHDDGFPPLPDDDVRGLALPVLLLGGERSPAIFHRLNDRLEELLPTVERVEIAGSSHSMHNEKPDAVNEAIASFLTSIRGPADR